MDGSGLAKRLGHLATSMAWLGVLYAGLLYVAVGTLGVSEINADLGDHAVEVFRTVQVIDQAQGEERAERNRNRRHLVEIERALDDAGSDLRAFGIAQGLPLDKIQPVVDNSDYAPRLSALLGTAADAGAEAKWGTLMAAVTRLQGDRNRLQQVIDQQDKALRADWSDSIKLSPPDGGGKVVNRTEVEAAANAANALRHLGYDRLFMLPREILSLVLALVMGALGSTLHVTKTMLENKGDIRPSYYLVRPFQGMVTALVVFILLKAGQLGISSGPSQGLNTFFVAFAGVVSGLMVTEAYQMIQKAAAGIIPPEDDEARWAFKLADALNGQQLPATDLAAGIGAAPADMDQWVAEKRPVPAEQQRLIAAWLHLPRRSLFTSLPPEGAVPDTADPAATDLSPVTGG